MTDLYLLLVLHLLGAAIWTGGHLILTFGVLPSALKATRHRSPFEHRFERLGYRRSRSGDHRPDARPRGCGLDHLFDGTGVAILIKLALLP